jgi:hypothetical protein
MNYIFIIEKRFDPADSHEQDSAIVEGAGGNDRMIKNLIKTKN